MRKGCKMAYKIAIGSSDGINVDLKFGEVESFYIYNVEDSKYELFETRAVNQDEKNEISEERDCADNGCGSNGCSGNGHGCSGPTDVIDKVTLIEDCRCVVCKKIGFQAQKQFERKAISVFDVECEISEPLEKISNYYEKIDNHRSMRK